MNETEQSPVSAGANLLLVDDDITFCDVLAEALSDRGYQVRKANDVPSALEIIADIVPDYAIVDLQMPGPNGLELIPKLCEINKAMKLVVLTGYSSIATAVEAIKLGATHYLTKPADAEEIVAAFERLEGTPHVALADKPISISRLEWEHIHRVLRECDDNISAAARRLGMHRRTLQRKLSKRPARS